MSSTKLRTSTGPRPASFQYPLPLQSLLTSHRTSHVSELRVHFRSVISGCKSLLCLPQGAGGSAGVKLLCKVAIYHLAARGCW